MTQCLIKSFADREFPDCLKQAKVWPIFKKEDPLDKQNYKTVSILPLLSEVYEKLLYNRQSDHVENIFNVILCDFRKVHSMQHALFKLLQPWQHELDEKGMVETVLMDLSNAYELLIIKLLANVFINSQFKHATMIWMFGNKSSIDKIFKIHKRTLQINYDVCDESMKIPSTEVTIFWYIKNTCDTLLLKVTNPWRS